MFVTQGSYDWIRKDEIIQASLVVAFKKIKGPIHVVEYGHHLRNRPPPSPTAKETNFLKTPESSIGVKYMYYPLCFWWIYKVPFLLWSIDILISGK